MWFSLIFPMTGGVLSLAVKSCALRKAAYPEDNVSFNGHRYDHLIMHPLCSNKEKESMIVLCLNSCRKSHKQALLIHNDHFLVLELCYVIFIFYWRIVDLKCVRFRCTAK